MVLTGKKSIKSKFRLFNVSLFIICFSISLCFAAPNTSSQKIKSTSAVNAEPVDNGKSKLPEDMNSNNGNLRVEQIQNNLPRASRPRFPSPKPNPEPAPMPAEKGLSND